MSIIGCQRDKPISRKREGAVSLGEDGVKGRGAREVNSQRIRQWKSRWKKKGGFKYKKRAGQIVAGQRKTFFILLYNEMGNRGNARKSGTFSRKHTVA